jgi:hypothetical protein
MTKLQNLSAIDTNQKEGRYLLAALAVLTTSPELTIQGESVRGSATHPDDMLDRVYALQETMFKDATPIPDDVVFEKPIFATALQDLINSYSKENGSNTPDFILAQYLMDCLDAFDKCSRAREKWFGKELTIGG